LHADTYVRRAGRRRWQECRALDLAQGERRYVEDVYITKEHAFGPVHLIYYWDEEEDDPGRLVTNGQPDFSACRLDQRHMGIEELFGELQDGALSRNRAQEPIRRMGQAELSVRLPRLPLRASSGKIVNLHETY
jgi:hypothetical protein